MSADHQFLFLFSSSNIGCLVFIINIIVNRNNLQEVFVIVSAHNGSSPTSGLRHGHDLRLVEAGHPRRPVRLRRRRNLLRRMGGRKGARTRGLHRAQRPGGVLRVVALWVRSFRGLHMAEVGKNYAFKNLTFDSLKFC